MRLRFALAPLALVPVLAVAPGPTVCAQQASAGRGWWAAIEMGHGWLTRSEDGAPSVRRGRFAMGFAGGATLSSWLRAGFVLRGWTLEASDVWDPAKGESVSEAGLEIRANPPAARGAWVTTTFARTTYTNHHPGDFTSSGWGAGLDVGVDLRVLSRLALAPVVSWHQGTLGEVHNLVLTSTGRRFHASSLALRATYR